jgi:hypothetical protein
LIRLTNKVGGMKAGSDGDSGGIRNWVRSGFAIPASYRTSPRQVGFVWVRLGSFWVCFWAAEGGGIVVTLLHETCCVDFGSFQDWVRFA